MVATASQHEKVLIFALYRFDGTKRGQETSPNTVARIQQYFERKFWLPKLATCSVPLFQNLQPFNLCQAHKSKLQIAMAQNLHPPKWFSTNTKCGFG